MASAQHLGFGVRVKNGTSSTASLTCLAGEYTASLFIPALSLLSKQAAVRIPSMTGSFKSPSLF